MNKHTPSRECTITVHIKSIVDIVRRTMAQRKEKLLAVDAVAEILDITIDAARKRIQRGQLPAVKMGRKWRVKETALQAYIAGLTSNDHQGLAHRRGPT